MGLNAFLKKSKLLELIYSNLARIKIGNEVNSVHYFNGDTGHPVHGRRDRETRSRG